MFASDCKVPRSGGVFAVKWAEERASTGAQIGRSPSKFWKAQPKRGFGQAEMARKQALQCRPCEGTRSARDQDLTSVSRFCPMALDTEQALRHRRSFRRIEVVFP